MNQFFKFKNIICYSYLFVSIVLMSIFVYIFLSFPFAKMDEIFFVLAAPVGPLNDAILKDLLLNFLTPFLLLTILMAYLIKKLSKFKCLAIFSAITVSLLICFVVKYQVVEFVKNQLSETDFIENHYVNPNTVSLRFPKKKKNLIHIYLESMEANFVDYTHKGSLSVNIIPELFYLAKIGEDFSNSKDFINGTSQTEGTLWTMGAIWGQETGLPLKLPLGISRNGMTLADHFFPNIIGLGNILSNQGYVNVVIRGSDTSFAGADQFYKEHGNYEVIDYRYALNNKLIPNDYKVWWGYEDEKLFDIAKSKLLDLYKTHKPFNLTLVTADTHFEDGYVCRKCSHDYNDQYANVIACSSRQVFEFYNWLKMQPFFEDTVIVLSGDHKTMDRKFPENFINDNERKGFFTILNSNKKTMIHDYRSFTNLDVLPTMLSAMNVDIEGSQLGLGVDLFSDKRTLLETIPNLNNELLTSSSFMENQSKMVSSKEVIEKNLASYLIFVEDDDTKDLIRNIVLNDKDSYYEFGFFSQYLSDIKKLLAKDERFMFVLVQRGPFSRLQKDMNNSNSLAKDLNDFGFKVDLSKNNNTSYYAIINKRFLREEIKDNEFAKYSNSIKNHKLTLLSSPFIDGDSYAFINFDDFEYSKNVEGLNMMVADLKTGYVFGVRGLALQFSTNRLAFSRFSFFDNSLK